MHIFLPYLYGFMWNIGRIFFKNICIIVFIWPFLFGHLFTSLLTNIQSRLCSEPNAISEETAPGTPTSTYYAGNQENPVFNILKSRREMTKDEREAQITQTVLDLLVKPPHSSLVCTLPPRSVRHNRAFIVDTSTDKALEEDPLADDSGVWLNNGLPRFFYERSGPGNAELTRAGRDGLVDETSLQEPWIVVHRQYYLNKRCPEFRRTVTFMKGMACL